MKRAHLLLIVTCGLTSLGLADSWVYPEADIVFFSANGRFRFTALVPDRNKQSLPRHTLFDPSATNDTTTSPRGRDCIGVLEDTAEERPRIVWRKKLVNPVSPLDGMITDDGAFVVTFDTWFGVGEDPIVIYDRKGRLVRRHSLETLDLVRFTWLGVDVSEPKIRNSVSSTYWKEDGLVFFSHDQTKLLVLLNWGHFFGVRLVDGKLMDASQLTAEIPFIDTQIRKRVAALLASERPAERRQGARLVSARKLTEFIPRLRDLLNDSAADTGYTMSDGKKSKSFREYYVRMAAFESLTSLGETVDRPVLREEFEDGKDPAMFGRPNRS